LERSSLVDNSDRTGESVSGNVGGLNRLAGGLGDGVLDVSAGNLGDSVAVLNLDGDDLHLGVVDAVLGGDLVAGVLDGGHSRVGNSMGNGGDSSVGNRGNSGVGKGSTGGVGKGSTGNMGTIGGSNTSIEDLSISLSLSLGLSISLSLHDMGNSRGGVTDGVNNILADLLVLDLLGVNKFLGADVLSSGNAGLGHQDLVLNLAVGGGGSHHGGSSQRCSGSNVSSMRNGSYGSGGSQGSTGTQGSTSNSSYWSMERSGSKETAGVQLGVSISFSFSLSSWCSVGSCGKEENGINL